jgi:serine/threonine protein kinase
VFSGTLRYMAPEVVLGRSYNQSVDVYSFSVLIWQIATGVVSFFTRFFYLI